MDLEQFVASALTQITKGILVAQESTRGTGALINPKSKPGEAALKGSQVVVTREGNQVAQMVAFDLAVTVAETSKVNGEAGIQVWGVKIGGGAGEEASSATLSKISFSVPVVWPTFKNETP